MALALCVVLVRQAAIAMRDSARLRPAQRRVVLIASEPAGGHARARGSLQRPDGAEVVELAGLVNLDTWPAGTRLIVRRERPHPGAQLSLFDAIDGFRHAAFIINTPGTDIVALVLCRGQRARAGEVIRQTLHCQGHHPRSASASSCCDRSTRLPLRSSGSRRSVVADWCSEVSRLYQRMSGRFGCEARLMRDDD
jgi:hypothetical protein